MTNRERWIYSLIAGLGVSALAACGQAPTPTPTRRPEPSPTQVPFGVLRPSAPTSEPTIVKGVSQPSKPDLPGRYTHEIKEGDTPIIGYGQWAEFDGGIIVNQCPWLTISVNGNNLYEHLKNPTLGLRNPGKKPSLLVLVPTITDQDTFQQGEIFKAGRLTTINLEAKQKIEPDYVFATPVARLIEHSRAQLPPAAPVALAYEEVGRLLTNQLATSQMAVANETRPLGSRFVFDNNKMNTLRQNPIFQVLLIN